MRTACCVANPICTARGRKHTFTRFARGHRRLLISSFWPIVLLVIFAAGSTCWEFAQDRMNQDALLIPRTKRQAVQAGLYRAMPLTLVLTFVLVPSTATRIFKTFLCRPFEYDGSKNEVRRYLYDDLYLSCTSDTYAATHRSAVALIVVWPVGVPLMYAILLWVSRDALWQNRSTGLSRATDFLSSDYSVASFWWEPLEMCRKLTLTGWLLLIREDFEQARVLAAILVSIGFLSLRLTIRPLRRCIKE